MQIEDYKQLLKLMCDETNVKNIEFPTPLSAEGDKIFISYNLENNDIGFYWRCKRLANKALDEKILYFLESIFKKV